MALKPKIKQLPDDVLAAVNAALAEGVTYTQIADALRALGYEASKSGVGRYSQEQKRLAARADRAMRMAEAYINGTRGKSESNIVQGAIEQLGALLLEVAENVDEEGKVLFKKPAEVKDLSRALESIAKARKMNADAIIGEAKHRADQEEQKNIPGEGAGGGTFVIEIVDAPGRPETDAAPEAGTALETTPGEGEE